MYYLKKLTLIKIINFKLFLISFFIFNNLFAELKEYFKPILDKSENHKMENIDFIYMINLDERPEKFEKSIQQLHPYGIYPYRFSAVNGWKLSLNTVNDVGIKYEQIDINSDSYKKYMNNMKWATHYECNSNYNETLPASQQANPQHSYLNTPRITYFSHCLSLGGGRDSIKSLICITRYMQFYVQNNLGYGRRY